MAAGGPGAPYGVAGCPVVAPLGVPFPPALATHGQNTLGRDIRGGGSNAPTVRCFPPKEGGTRLTVAHFRKGWPVYHDALSQLGELPRPLVLMLPTNLAVALSQLLDGQDRLRPAWEAVARGALLSLSGRGDADVFRWDALVPHLAGRHAYMTTARGHPRQDQDDLIAAFEDHRVLPDDTWQAFRQKTLSVDYWRRVPARLP